VCIAGIENEALLFLLDEADVCASAASACRAISGNSTMDFGLSEDQQLFKNSLRRFLDHAQAHERVWVCRRIDVARHWRAAHPFDAASAFIWN